MRSRLPIWIDLGPNVIEHQPFGYVGAHSCDNHRDDAAHRASNQSDLLQVEQPDKGEHVAYNFAKRIVSAASPFAIAIATTVEREHAMRIDQVGCYVIEGISVSIKAMHKKSDGFIGVTELSIMKPEPVHFDELILRYRASISKNCRGEAGKQS